MMRLKFLFPVLVAFLFGGVIFSAESDINKEILFKLFRSPEKKSITLFDASFLAEVPPQKINEILKLYKKQLGPLRNITGREGKYTLIFENGTAPATISINTDHKIVGLWFGNWTLNNDTKEKILAEFKKCRGDVSVCVIKNNNQTVLAYRESVPMASGSSFKLYVLKAVYDAVRNGRASWDTVILLKNQNKSLPSGMLQDWPDITPVTVRTLTNLMISISDNTAADHLIDFVGKNAIEKYVTDANKPFLKTSEAFKLKFGIDNRTLQQYVKSVPAEREKILHSLADMKLSKLNIPGTPVSIKEIEWFFSTGELCRTIYDLKDCPEIQINPGLADKKDWSRVGYKGGSEPGVLQFTHVVKEKNGEDWYALSVTVNDTQNDVDEAKISELTARIMNLIKNGTL